MAAEYELEGVIHQEPLPRIALVNFFDSTCNDLTERRHNVYSFPSTLIRRTGRRRVTALKPAHEVEILIVRDRVNSKPLPASLIAGRPGIQAAEFFDTQIALANGPTLSFSKYCHGIFNQGGVCVFLVSDSPGGLLDCSGLWMTTDTDNKIKTSSASFKPISNSGYEFLTSFIERWRKVPERYVGIQSTAGVRSFLEDTASNKLVVLLKLSGALRPGIVLCLPDYGERSDILDGLLRDVLPELSPLLFPHRFDDSWQNEPTFTHHSVTKLEAEKNNVRACADETIKKLDQEIDAYKKEDQWLMGLLLTGDDPLKHAVKKGLEELLRFAGIDGVQVLDVDNDPSLRDGSGQNVEDLRISLDGKHFLIDVAGNDSPLKEGRINQLDKHKKLFLATNPLASQYTQGVLIANYNKRGGTDPSKRGAMFGTGTVQANERLKNAGHSAISTLDLFKLIRTIQRGEVSLRQEDVVSFLMCDGILEFDNFIKSLQQTALTKA